MRTWLDGHRRPLVGYGALVPFVHEVFLSRSTLADPVSWPASTLDCLSGLSAQPISLFSECRVHDMVVENNILNHVYLLLTCFLRRRRDRGSVRPTHLNRSRIEREWSPGQGLAGSLVAGLWLVVVVEVDDGSRQTVLGYCCPT